MKMFLKVFLLEHDTLDTGQPLLNRRQLCQIEKRKVEKSPQKEEQT
jgi:hypothetical protein